QLCAFERARYSQRPFSAFRRGPRIGQHIGPPGEIERAALDLKAGEERRGALELALDGCLELEAPAERFGQRSLAHEVHGIGAARELDAPARKRPGPPARRLVSKAYDGLIDPEATGRQLLERKRLDVAFRQGALTEELNAPFARANELDARIFERE